eukprot:207954-Pelagomonas_calceolata.AAC.1
MPNHILGLRMWRAPVWTRLKYLGLRGLYLSCHQYTCTCNRIKNRGLHFSSHQYTCTCNIIENWDLHLSSHQYTCNESENRLSGGGQAHANVTAQLHCKVMDITIAGMLDGRKESVH